MHPSRLKCLAFSEKALAMLASNPREKSSVSLPRFMSHRETSRGVHPHGANVQREREREREREKEKESERTHMIRYFLCSFVQRTCKEKIIFVRRKCNVGVAAELRCWEFKSPVLPEGKIALRHGCFKVPLSSCRLPDCERLYDVRSALCLFRLLLFLGSRRCGKEKHLWMRLIDSVLCCGIYIIGYMRCEDNCNGEFKLRCALIHKIVIRKTYFENSSTRVYSIEQAAFYLDGKPNKSNKPLLHRKIPLVIVGSLMQMSLLANNILGVFDAQECNSHRCHRNDM